MIMMKKFHIIAFLVIITRFKSQSLPPSHHYNQLQVSTDLPNPVVNSTCPPWTLPIEGQNGSISCRCGNSLNGVVYCDQKSLDVYVLIYHCMTQREATGELFVGYCTYNSFSTPVYNNDCHTYMYTKLTAKYLAEVNLAMCSSYQDTGRNREKNFHRTGLMCGSCEEGFAPPVYSYSLACVECMDYNWYNWLKYLAVAFLPLTAFCFIVILFRVTVTTGTMSCYVLLSQLLATPLQARNVGITFPRIRYLYTTIGGIWNLDFFRDLYTPFCLHPNMNTLQTLVLDYGIAIYPLQLVAFTYLFVLLHKHCRFVVWIWSPFYKFFTWFRREWDIQNSVIRAFATFVLLSYVKILYTSFDILTPGTLYDVHGNKLKKCFVYYQGDYEYFGSNHLPYAFLALVMFMLFNVFPLLLLCLYPCRCFQRFLNCFRAPCLSLHILMDTIYAPYRLTPQDCRYFAALYLLVRIASLFLYVITTGPMFYPLNSMLLIITAVIIATAKPLKSSVHNALHVVLLASFGIGFLWNPFYTYIQTLDPSYHDLVNIVIGFLTLPILYGMGLLAYKLIPKKCLNRMKQCILSAFKMVVRRESEEQESLLHSQLEGTGENSPLLGVAVN